MILGCIAWIPNYIIKKVLIWQTAKSTSEHH